MKDQIRNIIRQGLYEDNLRKLVPLCKGLLTESPSLYGTLIYVCESLAYEYDNQGITVERSNLVEKTLKESLLNLLEDEEDPSLFVECLNNVFESHARLKGYLE